MITDKSKYVLVEEKLKSIRAKIKNLRHTPANDIDERIKLLKEVNQLLIDRNDLLIVRQRILEGNY